MTAVPKLPEAVIEMLAEGWTLHYSAATRFIEFRHPQGGRQSVMEISRGRSDQGFGEFIVAALSSRAAVEQASGGVEALPRYFIHHDKDRYWTEAHPEGDYMLAAEVIATRKENAP